MKYIPFLKLKQNEVLAFRRLDSERRDSVVPFFDIPRVKDIDEKIYKERIEAGVNFIQRALKKFNFSFYLDVYDIPDTIKPDGQHIYEYALEQFSEFDFIPVVGLDRHDDHISSTTDYMRSVQDIKHFAIRLSKDDILSHRLTRSNIEDMLSETIDSSDIVDLIIDLRVIGADELDEISQRIEKVIEGLQKFYTFNIISVASSSIHANASEMVESKSSKLINRNEWRLWKKLSALKDKYPDKFIYADYTVISPNYSDVSMPPELLSTIQTPKIIYTSPESAYITRGGAFKTSGYDQYFNLAEEIEELDFYRGREFSEGDRYIWDVASKSRDSCGNASSWIAQTINCHLSVMIDAL